MKHQILITGIGGQGVLFLTKLLATAAMVTGEEVFAYEIHGMSQRGGSVFSALKIGPFQSSQLFPGDVDTLFALEGPELFPYLTYLKPGGKIVLNPSRLNAADLEWLAGTGLDAFTYDADADALHLGQPRVANLILLGQFIRQRGFCLDSGAILAALQQMVKPRLFELNRRAFLGVT
jgi:indolepyruvate ferredoxin oxidoreductase beta subunit